MKFTDIIELAKAGFTPKDIREFMSQATTMEPEKSPDPESAPPAPEPEKDPDPTPPDAGVIPKNPENKVDYEEKYHELEKQLAELQKSLKQAQAVNIKQDASGGPKEDPQKIFSEAAAGFM